MNTAETDRWNALLDHLRGAVPQKEFATWFESLTFVSYKDERLVAGVPTKYVGDFIREHYGSVVARALAAVFGPKAQLFFRNEEAVRENERKEKERTEREQKTAGNTGAALPPLRSNLNENYSFDRFVEGESNKLAYAVARSIADHPGQTTFNPFFLYGPSGVGKTHLVNAMGLSIRERHPGKRVLFVSAHVFKTQYTDSVVHNTTNEFINFYQSIDVLIIDDIQEITTAKTQQAFFHIFNHLQQNRRQLVITCDRPPVLFEGIEERMLTRFKWGMVAEMEKPDTKLRKDILEAKIRRDGLNFPPEVVQYIAQSTESSVRELEGIVNGIMAYSIYDDCDIDLQLAARVIGRIVNLEKKELTPDDILSAVCEHYGVKQRDVVSKSRRQALVAPRQLVMYLCHKYTDLSYCQIGRNLGGRDHSTVLHGCNQVARRLSIDRAARREVEELEAVLKK